MKLTVIGFWGGFPEVDGATSCYLLEDKGFSLLLDFGSGSLSKLPKYKKVPDIDAVVISHYHADHIADIGVLQYALLVNAKITNKEHIVPIYGFENEEFSKLTHHYTKGVEYDPSKTLEIGPFKIDFLETIHSVPCYGMRITNGETVLVYTADSAYNEKWFKFSKNADIMISDCNFYAGMDASSSGHMTSEEAALIAKNANVKNLLLTHFHPTSIQSHLEKLKTEAGEVFKGEIALAQEGLHWDKKIGFH